MRRLMVVPSKEHPAGKWLQESQRKSGGGVYPTRQPSCDAPSNHRQKLRKIPSIPNRWWRSTPPPGNLLVQRLVQVQELIGDHRQRSQLRGDNGRIRLGITDRKKVPLLRVRRNSDGPVRPTSAAPPVAPGSQRSRQHSSGHEVHGTVGIPPRPSMHAPPACVRPRSSADHSTWPAPEAAYWSAPAACTTPPGWEH